MPELSAHELSKTYYCKAPGCTNEARSPVGRYAYCPEHQSTAARRPGAARASSNGASGGTERALRALLGLAKKVDKAKAKAEKLQGAANTASRQADELATEYRDAIASAARGRTLPPGGAT